MRLKDILRRLVIVAGAWLLVVGAAQVSLGGAATSQQQPIAPAATAVTIVDWYGDYVSSDTAMERYITVDYPVNLDGGNDDARAYLSFSDSQPINPKPGGGNAYGDGYATKTSWRFYGGILLQHYNGNFGSKWGEVWERGAHDKIYQSADARSDGWAVLYWKQADFLNGAAGETVTFDGQSSLAVLNYSGADGENTNNYGRVRFVVRDGTQLYVSQSYGDNATPAGFTLTNLPNQQWAPYHPSAPYNLKFDAANATFATHQFSNITAVGVYHSNDNSSDPNRRAGLNFERFRVVAAIQSATNPTPTPPNLKPRRYLPFVRRA